LSSGEALNVESLRRAGAQAAARGKRKVFGLKDVTPAVFVRMANKGVAAYGTWKCVRRMEEASAVKARRHRAEEERGWLVSNKWLTIITTPPPVFQKC
jgi:hypothetical protein